jgi:succinate dehydrogenase flavin-adding protein (antitoxin of CptAB toxin-antitoxin module)
MKIKELNSLLKLIDDPDPNIFEVVNKKNNRFRNIDCPLIRKSLGRRNK